MPRANLSAGELPERAVERGAGRDWESELRRLRVPPGRDAGARLVALIYGEVLRFRRPAARGVNDAAVRFGGVEDVGG